MTVVLDDLHPAYREALCFFEAFRRFGFASDDIYAMFAGTDGHVQLSVVLRTQGAECVAVAGFLPTTIAAVRALWLTVAAALRDGELPADGLDRAWRASMACAEFWGMPMVLARKGIRIPPLWTRPAPSPSGGWS